MAESDDARRDVAPVTAAEALLAHDVDERAILVYLMHRWELDEVDAGAAIAAARVLGRGDTDARTALPPEGDA